MRHSPNQASENLCDVGVVASRLGDGDSQLSVAEGAQRRYPPSQHPHDQSQAHGTRVLQDSLWRDEYSRPDDVPWEKMISLLIKFKLFAINY